ncbi:MAG: threonylcarbamoyl-AMP synthase [Rickettsiales bacterium]|nr:MAG: threonylcarbamoyl-AMP synthase [Rickettsiales bacterium]
MSQIEKAAKIIRAGGLVAFPTETVYGLGADAGSQDACLGIFKAKGRPSHNPLIVHAASPQQASSFAVFGADAQKLMKIWPAPLTLVLPIREGAKLAPCVTAGLETVAVRVPSDARARSLIEASGCPIAAPSANKSGRLSSTTYEHVQKNFGDSVFIVQDDGVKSCGLESTIIDLSTDTPTILRYGFITPELLSEALGKEVAIASKLSKIKAPGMLLKHYAPKTKIRLEAAALNPGEVGLDFGNSCLGSGSLRNEGFRNGSMSSEGGSSDSVSSAGSLNLSPSGDLSEAASNLFDYLHRLDEFALAHSIKTIAIAHIPNESVGLAINDRLSRAGE